ncbi:piwi domain-containing protein [Rhizophagus clarus]|uniref:Piwi domain-containing protein n=1 Tax=Rhizophagus clarus TaxID=94130 RepID=A0A8H3LP25_9GLOM|nr:piwi domain-containing protein [Rhizophagus clarus]
MEERPLQITRRPGLGNAGRRIRVRANFFEVLSMQETNILHYDVNITPVVPQRLNRKVFNCFVEQNQAALSGTKPVFDGKANMYASTGSLQLDADSFDVDIGEDDGAVTTRRPPRRFRIRLRRTRAIVLAELFQFLNGRADFTENCQMAIMAMDIIISHSISTKYPTVRRSFYTPQGSKHIFGGLEAWQGYYQSARPTRGRMMINVDLSASAFYESGQLIQVVAKILGLRSPDDLRRGFSPNDHHKVEDFVRRLRIKENHRTPQRKFKVEGLTQTPATHTTFDLADGGNTDVRTYFQNTHNKRLIFPFLPCVIVRRNSFIPIECCDIIPEQRYIRKLTGRQTDDMMTFARQNPNIRANKIQDGLNILDYRSNDYLRQFGIRISTDMTVVDARVLPTPTIQYHPSSRDHHVQPKDGVWNLRDKKLATGAILGSWAVLSFINENKLPDQAINVFLREFIDTCVQTGMDIPNKRPPICRENPIGNTEESLKKAWLKAGNVAKAQPQLIFCILPNTGQDLYGEIKRVGETVIGVATQCIQGVHTNRPKKQYCANVCLKINVKLGGMNSFLVPEHIPFVTEKPTILIGADVSHPGPDDDERPSFAAICGSMDARASRYAASIRVQERRYEIIADLANMVKELLKTFYQTCGRKPVRIVFYRDGISEGQFNSVLENEVKAIRAACQALEAGYKPTITFVVVQKRHHTRFFPMDRQNTDRSGNCLPGTVVDGNITHPFEFDFYLQSHAGLLGTSRPAHYHVLYDENGFNADSMQTLSYNLCYIYARCTRSVSLVPPVYYAHLVTNRARLHASGTPITFGVVKQELQKVMYFV